MKEMQNDIKVSVVVPVYQVEEKYLKECIESVLNQTLSDIELILVSDGASQENQEIIKNSVEADARVSAIFQTNQGVCVARNAGLRLCHGKYVTFVDSDDYIAKDNLEKAYKRAEGDKLELLLWGSYKCYSNKMVEYMPFKDDIPLFNQEQKEWLMLKTMVGELPFYGYPCSKYGSGSCCSKLYLRSFLEENDLKYPVGIKRAEDVNFNIRVFDKAEKIGYLNEHFYYYRQLESSATYKYRDGGIKVFTDALNGLKAFLDETGKKELFYQVFDMRCMFFFLESMDMDYLNKDNPKSFFKRMSEMKKMLNEEPYKGAIAELKGDYLTFARKIPLVLMKMKAVYLLAFFYTGFKMLQNIRR